jgi:hypothetical protein
VEYRQVAGRVNLVFICIARVLSRCLSLDVVDWGGVVGHLMDCSLAFQLLGCV